MTEFDADDLPLPRGWPGSTKRAMVSLVAMAHYALVSVRGWAVNSRIHRVRLQAQLEESRQEIALLAEELRIKDTRMHRIPAHQRPHYTPQERLAIMELKAMRNLSSTQIASRFLVGQPTITSWQRRLDETGPDTLLKMTTHVNRFPEFVKYVVQRLCVLCPLMGKVKMAQILARAGLHLAATTIERYRKEEPVEPKDKAATVAEEQTKPRIVTTNRPNHVWHVDLTCMPTGGGFWVPWTPQALVQVWPFCWWMAIVVDHYSRRIMGVAVFKKQPASIDIRQFIARCISKAGTAPKYLICDKGVQFWNEGFKQWCKRKTIKPRFGAIGKHGSIAVIERFIRSLKEEYLKRLLIPLRMDAMRQEIACYTHWYNEHRPHQSLNGATPLEMYERTTAANQKPRYEPRRQWPPDAPCAAPYAPPKPNQDSPLTLVIRFADRHRKLPIIELRQAA